MDFVALLETPFRGNPLRDWLIALGIALSINIVVGAVKWISRVRLRALAERTPTPLDDSLVAAALHTKQLLILVISLVVGAHYLELSELFLERARMTAVVAAFLQAGLYLGAMIEFWGSRSKQRALESDPSAATTMGAIKFVGNILMWSVLLLLMLDNLGVNVTALVAGLGVGGIAVALAVQNILGDLFASLSIVVDKPFVLGDFVIVDNYMGNIEHIGLKTTRIRSLGGEQLVFANSDLLKARLRNMQRMQERRVVFRFGVLYSTDATQLARIPDTVREIVTAQDEVRFDRAHFQGFGPSSLDFEVVYWVLAPDYARYMDVQQAINLGIVEAFRAAGIGFAFPTQTVHVESLPPLPWSAAGSG